VTSGRPKSSTAATCATRSWFPWWPGLTAAYGFVLLGAVRAREHQEHGNIAQAVIYAAIAVAGLATTLAGITLGLVFIAD
jgi:hypothetical protein